MRCAIISKWIGLALVLGLLAVSCVPPFPPYKPPDDGTTSETTEETNGTTTTEEDDCEEGCPVDGQTYTMDLASQQSSPDGSAVECGYSVDVSDLTCCTLVNATINAGDDGGSPLRVEASFINDSGTVGSANLGSGWGNTTTAFNCTDPGCANGTYEVLIRFNGDRCPSTVELDLDLQ